MVKSASMMFHSRSSGLPSQSSPVSFHRVLLLFSFEVVFFATFKEGNMHFGVCHSEKNH